VSLIDVFLETGGTFDRDAVETALAANGIAGDGATLATADGGAADVTLEDDSIGFLVDRLTPDLARIVFDVARAASLAILPVDGTPTAIVVGETVVPEDLEPVRAHTPNDVHEALSRSVAARRELRGAHPA
jgi:hypothetical protein